MSVTHPGRVPVRWPESARPVAPRGPRRARRHGLESGVVLGVLGGVVASGAGVVLAYDLSGGRLALPCPVHRLTGLDCPLCGGTRMVVELLHGQVVGAVQANALALLLAPVVGYLLVAGVLRRFSPVRLPVRLPAPGPRALRRLGYATAVAAGLFTLARNLPFGPFAALHV